MLFYYLGKTYGNTVCTNCYETVPGDTLPTDAEIWLDGLPVGHEKEYLQECVIYWPNCGQTVLNAPHFGFSGHKIKMPAGQNKEDVLSVLYAKYGNEYIQGAYYEFVGDKAIARQLYLAYAAREGREENLKYAGWWNQLRMVDLYRRLKYFDDAKRVLKYTEKENPKNRDPLYQYVFNAEKEKIKKHDAERMVLPKPLTIGRAI